MASSPFFDMGCLVCLLMGTIEHSAGQLPWSGIGLFNLQFPVLAVHPNRTRRWFLSSFWSHHVFPLLGSIEPGQIAYGLFFPGNFSTLLRVVQLAAA
jgi:hypothetical protein